LVATSVLVRLQVIRRHGIGVVDDLRGQFPAVQHDEALQSALADLLRIQRFLERLVREHEDAGAAVQPCPVPGELVVVGHPQALFLGADVRCLIALKIAPLAQGVVDRDLHDLARDPRFHVRRFHLREVEEPRVEVEVVVMALVRCGAEAGDHVLQAVMDHYRAVRRRSVVRLGFGHASSS